VIRTEKAAAAAAFVERAAVRIILRLLATAWRCISATFDIRETAATATATVERREKQTKNVGEWQHHLHDQPQQVLAHTCSAPQP
jgi:hypothetical protein